MSGPTERKKGIQIHRGIVYGSHARLLTAEEAKLATPGHTHRWTVFLQSATTPPPTFRPGGGGKGKGKGKAKAEDGAEVEDENDDFITGGADDLSWLIKRVTFRLHETYPSPNRPVDKPPYRVTETGWGEFPLNIRVQFQPETGEKTISFGHQLRLHHWGPAAVGPSAPAPARVAVVVGEEVDATNKPAGAAAGTPGTPGPEGETPKETGSAGTPTGDAGTPRSAVQGSVGDMDAEGEEDVGMTPQETEPTEVDVSAGTPKDGEDQGEDVQMLDVGEVKDEPMDPTETTTTSDAPMTGSTGHPPTSSSSSSAPTINPLPVHSWQYDQFVFTDPTTTLYQLLLSHPETTLPRRSVRKGQDPGEGAILGLDRGSAGVPLEFTEELEMAERERMENARKELVEETDRWRQRLIELEREAQQMKDQIAAV